MAGYWTRVLDKAGITPHDRKTARDEVSEHFSHEVESYLKDGDHAWTIGKSHRAAEQYMFAIKAGAKGPKIEGRLRQLVTQISAKPKRTEFQREYYQKVMAEILEAEDMLQGKPPSEHTANWYRLTIPKATGATAAIAALMIGMGAMLAASFKPTGYFSLSGGDESMILVAFLLIVLVYFYEARPKKKR